MKEDMAVQRAVDLVVDAAVEVEVVEEAKEVVEEAKEVDEDNN